MHLASRLTPFVSDGFAEGPPLANALIPAELRAIYTNFNGGYFWGRALLVRPISRLGSAPLGVLEWNAESLWRTFYEGACANVTFFAEDAFGIPFGVHNAKVVQFDLETAELTEIAATVNGFVECLLNDVEFLTGAPVLSAWEQEHGALEPGHRLIPKRPFIFGGEFRADNMVAKEDTTGMRIRAEFWRSTKNLPDGTSVALRLVD
jgi:hypothetical protein